MKNIKECAHCSWTEFWTNSKLASTDTGRIGMFRSHFETFVFDPKVKLPIIYDFVLIVRIFRSRSMHFIEKSRSSEGEVRYRKSIVHALLCQFKKSNFRTCKNSKNIDIFLDCETTAFLWLVFMPNFLGYLIVQGSLFEWKHGEFSLVCLVSENQSRIIFLVSK